MKAIADLQLELPFPVAGGLLPDRFAVLGAGPETAPRAAGGAFKARRSCWGRPGVCCRAHSGPVPGHGRPHLLPQRVHILPQRARRALLEP